MAQTQKTRAGGRKAVDAVDGGETPVVNAPLDVRAPTSNAEKLAETLKAGSPWIERELAEHRNKKKLQAKKKAIRNQLNPEGKEPEELIEEEDMDRFEAAAVQDTSYYLQAREAEQELAAKQSEWANTDGVDVKAKTDEFIDNQLMELDTDEEINTYLPVLERQRLSGLKQAKEQHIRRNKQEAVQLTETMAEDLKSQGATTKKMVKLFEERAGKMPGMTKEQGKEMFLNKVGQMAAEEGRPELLDGFYEAGYGDSDTLAPKLQEYRAKADGTKQAEGASNVVQTRQSIIDAANSANFGEKHKDIIRNRTTELFGPDTNATEQILKFQNMHKQAAQQKQQGIEEFNAQVEAYHRGEWGTDPRWAEQSTKKSRAAVQGKVMDNLVKEAKKNGIENPEQAAFGRFMKLMNQNGEETQYEPLNNMLNGGLTINSSDGNMPEQFRSSYALYSQMRENPELADVADRHLDEEAKDRLALVDSFLDGGSSLEDAYVQANQAEESKMTETDFFRSDAKGRIDEVVDDLEADQQPDFVRNKVKEWAYDYGRLKGVSNTQAVDIAKKKFNRQFQKFDGRYVYTGGKKYPEWRHTAIKEYKRTNKAKLAKAFGMQSSELDMDKVTLVPNHHRRDQLVPYYGEEPAPELSVSLQGQLSKYRAAQSERYENQARAHQRNSYNTDDPFPDGYYRGAAADQSFAVDGDGASKAISNFVDHLRKQKDVDEGQLFGPVTKARESTSGRNSE